MYPYTANLRHDAVNAKNSNKGKQGGRGGKGSRTNTAVDECGNEIVDRVARYRPVRLISERCATIALNPTVLGSFCFVFVEFKGGSAKAVVRTPVVLLGFFFALFLALLPYFPPHRPYSGVSFLFFVLFRPCKSYLFLFSSYVVLLAAFLIFLLHIFQNSRRGFCSYFPYLYGLACFVEFSYPVG